MLSVFMSISWWLISGKAEPSSSGTPQGVFLSSAERFAPPRDILLEEPDTLNPGIWYWIATNFQCIDDHSLYM